MSYVENDKEAIRVMEAAIGYKGLMFENIERRLHDRVWEAVERAAREIGAGSVRDGTLDPWAEDVAELAREMEAIRLDPHHTGIWGDQWPPEEDEPAAVKDA